MLRSPLAAAVAIGLVVASLVLALGAQGWFQRADLALYDLYLSLEPVPAQTDPRVAILAITENDIAELVRAGLSNRRSASRR